jgi:hypothetical protein
MKKIIAFVWILVISSVVAGIVIPMLFERVFW